MKCPSCGADASGKFCSSCGKPLEVVTCPACGGTAPAGARFCTSCGSPLPGVGSGKPRGSGSSRARGTGGPGDATGPGRSASSNLAWWVAGAFLVLLLVALGYPILTRDNAPAQGGGSPPGMGAGTGAEAPVDLTALSLEEQGTILFNRVMSSSSAGDTADVNFFLPKALIIYEQLDPSDPDGLYHFALLHQVGGDPEAALAKAEEGLAETPDYLLLLAVAAEAQASLGNDSAAAELYQRLLDVYDSEMALMRPGYEHHQTIFPVYRDEARAFLGQVGG